MENEVLKLGEHSVPFPKNFLQICKKILCRLFRVFVHVYIHHFDRIILIGAEAHVNTCYKHFYYFVTELNLIDRKELEPLVLTSNLAKWQQEKEDLQGKLKSREHLSQTAGKSEVAPAPSKSIDLEMKQYSPTQNSNIEITKLSTTIKSLKNEVEQKEERVQELQAMFPFPSIVFGATQRQLCSQYSSD
ncbi:hypothetical protein ASZ78_013269 [Callipepla squamata]|uniref:Mob1/phocein family protein n=1 Tax=Callipepla squamata TaxID=9009 RepID=A0A226N827_CALSU|nr:hypothetical protein ASZ78_013269 [Callipepla squamata]